MKTIPENLPAIVEAVKPTRDDFTLTVRTDVPWTAPDPDYVWVCNKPDGGQAFSYATPDAAYAACVVALLGRMKGDTIIRRGQKYPLWGIAGSGDLQAFAIDADILTALYAAFVARPDLFGEAQ